MGPSAAASMGLWAERCGLEQAGGRALQLGQA